MAKAKAIIKRRKVVQNTRKITRTMELVSTAKYKQSFDRVEGAMPYRATLETMMHDLASAGVEVEHPLLQSRERVRHTTLLLLTSNRGLCGGFNTNLCKMAAAYRARCEKEGSEVALHVVGKKGVSFMRFQHIPMAQEYVTFGDSPKYTEVEEIADRFIRAYVDARTDRVAVVHQHFVSAAVQRPRLQVLLPLSTAAESAAGRDAGTAPAAAVRSEYLYSPDAATLLQELLPAYFKTSLYHVFLENVVGEHRARMVAMKNATDNAQQMVKYLTRQYNRARQTQITNEISEIMGGVEALK